MQTVIIEDPYSNKKYNILVTAEELEEINNGNYEVGNFVLQKTIEADNFSAAFKIMSSQQCEESRNELHTAGSVLDMGSNTNCDVDCDEEEKENEHSLLWTQKIPTANDKKATEELLTLLSEDKWKRRTKDSKTRKKVVYKKIYEMNIGNSVEHGIVRVNQKWRNLQKTYMKFMTNMRNTGRGKMEKPAFFDLLDSILGDKHKVHPPILHDSLNTCTVSQPIPIVKAESVSDCDLQDKCVTDCQESEERCIQIEDSSGCPTCETVDKKSAMLTPKRTAKPKRIIEDMKEIILNLEKGQKERFNRLEKLLIEQNEQRKRSNDILESLISKRIAL